MKGKKLNFKTYVLKTPYKDYKRVIVAPFITRYAVNNRLCIVLEDVKTGETWGTLTVNIDADFSMKSDLLAFVDTDENDYEDNDMSYVLKFIEDNNLGRPTNAYGYSGFCVYPEYAFDISKLNDEKAYEEYCKGEF